MDKLKIGLFIDTYFPMVDGVIMVVDNYARRLSKFCDVTVFCPKVKGYSKKDDDEKPYKIVRCRTLFFPGFSYSLGLPKFDRKFLKMLNNSNLDIVHIHSPFSLGKIGTIYAKKHKVPAVASFHSQFKQDFMHVTNSKVLTNFLLKMIMKVFNSCYRCYTVNSRMVKVLCEYGAKEKPLIQKNSTDLLPVKDTLEAREQINKRFNIDKDLPVFLFVGRITILKGVLFIVEALKILKGKGFKFKMIFVGTGSDENRLKQQVKKDDLEGDVIFAGKIVDRKVLSYIYFRADLFLFPSMYDANSLVQIEAASQKTPTVFLKGSATSSDITGDVNGFIVENSPEKYANKIYAIMNDKALYDKVSENCFKDLYLTWDEAVKKMYKRYIDDIKEFNKKASS